MAMMRKTRGEMKYVEELVDENGGFCWARKLSA